MRENGAGRSRTSPFHFATRDPRYRLRECETKEGKIDRIELDIQLTGSLTDEQRANSSKSQAVSGPSDAHV